MNIMLQFDYNRVNLGFVSAVEREDSPLCLKLGLQAHSWAGDEG